MPYDHRPWLKSYDDGVRADLEIPKLTLKDMFREASVKNKDQAAFHFMGVTWTFGRLYETSERLAKALTARGIGPGDVVSVNLPNLPQYLVAVMGAVRAGCVVNGLAPLLTAEEMKYQLNDSGAKAVITLDVLYANRLKGILDRCPQVALVIATGIADHLPPMKRLLGKWLKKIPAGQVTPFPGKEVVFLKTLLVARGQPPETNLKPEDPCFLQYTGGTTGPPKGAILTHGNLVANIAQFEEWTKSERGLEIYLSGFPMFHQAGLMVATSAMALGSTQILIPDPRNTGHIVKEIARYRPTFLINVPSLYLMLLADPNFRKLDFSSVKFCLSGAAPFPAEGIRDLESVVGSGKMVEVFGMTETSPLITSNPLKKIKKIGSVGLPLPGTRLRIVDLTDGRTSMPLGEEGEIIASGAQIMKGYHNKPEESKNALRVHDGLVWMHTGDVGRMDEDGFLYIVDRAKDMLNVGGFKVFSREVEDKLYEHPAIELCAIIGVPNPDRPGSEIVKLVVQRSAAYSTKSEDETKSEILAMAREKLSPYKVPRIITFVDAMPLTNVGKVDKKALR